MYIISILIICIPETSMGKTTVVIDEKLLKDAIDAIGARSKKEAIEAGLRALVREYNREALRKELGTFDIELTLDELERLRNVE
jgi:Arc/MetJ family transcription regulator